MKINKKEGDDYMCYLWKNYECEICLTEYPKYAQYKDLTYPMIDLEVPFSQYMVFDYALFDDTKKKSLRKGIIVVKLQDEEEITLGRTQTNTIKLKDISVSRMHCYFIRRNGQIHIYDKGSKFGTLLYSRKPVTINQINQGKIVNLVAGKHMLSLSLSKSWNIFSSLFSNISCCTPRTVSSSELTISKDEGSNKLKQNCNLDDSYDDLVISLQSIIRHSDICNNNSFI